MPLVFECLEAERLAFGRESILTERLAIIMYEVGELAKSVVWAEKSLVGDKGAYYANALVNLCDTMAQLAMLREQLMDPYTLSSPTMTTFLTISKCLELGMERQLERMEEWKGYRRSD